MQPFLESTCSWSQRYGSGAERKRGHEGNQQSFPEGMEYNFPFDMTTYISQSIHEVYKTLFEALVLVIIVVFLSLQSWRATLIPVVAVPISLIGTFGFMLIFGFSLNMLTLLGLVLAIGIVVDDAIVEWKMWNASWKKRNSVHTKPPRKPWKVW